MQSQETPEDLDEEQITALKEDIKYWLNEVRTDSTFCSITNSSIVLEFGLAMGSRDLEGRN